MDAKKKRKRKKKIIRKIKKEVKFIHNHWESPNLNLHRVSLLGLQSEIHFDSLLCELLPLFSFFGVRSFSFLRLTLGKFDIVGKSISVVFFPHLLAIFFWSFQSDVEFVNVCFSCFSCMIMFWVLLYTKRILVLCCCGMSIVHRGVWIMLVSWWSWNSFVCGIWMWFLDWRIGELGVFVSVWCRF